MKVFRAIWGDGYIEPGASAREEIKPGTWITEQWGYSFEDMEAINNLHIGEAYNVAGVLECHCVVRIK